MANFKNSTTYSGRFITDSDAVLDGDIDDFIKAYLTSTVGKGQ